MRNDLKYLLTCSHSGDAKFVTNPSLPLMGLRFLKQK